MPEGGLLNREQSEAEKKIGFEMQICLASSDASATWVQFPSHLSLQYASRTFKVKVVPDDLQPGCHFTSIIAYDAKDPRKGRLFDVPVTVVKARKVTEEMNFELEIQDMSFSQGTVRRSFVIVPDHASWARVELLERQQTTCGPGTRNSPGKSGSGSGTQYVLHAIQ
ncbi:unnamed protein product, partial [Darwinula stevensoni]